MNLTPDEEKLLSIVKEREANQLDEMRRLPPNPFHRPGISAWDAAGYLNLKTNSGRVDSVGGRLILKSLVKKGALVSMGNHSVYRGKPKETFATPDFKRQREAHINGAWAKMSLNNGNPINMYTCRFCGKQIITIDREDGVTPFMIPCQVRPMCPGNMMSHMYQVDQTLIPTHEWYQPTGKVSRKYRQHVEMGGLLLRRIKEKPHAKSE